MRVVTSVQEMKSLAREARARGRSLALVPTLGALHEGHQSLIRRAKRQCDLAGVSIFVNPTQFDSPADFSRYPRDFNRDLEVARLERADVVFAPAVEEMYPNGFAACVDPGALARPLEGASRPGHFQGVATVVLKLLNVLLPDVVYFGQKDFQQALIIRGLIADLNLDTRIALCPIVRDADGLAWSSRNALLGPQDRSAALALSRSLERARKLVHGGEVDAGRIQREMESIFRAAPRVRLDYAAIVNPTTLKLVERIVPGSVALVAAGVGEVRLIDNLIFGPPDASPDLLLQLALASAPVLDSEARVPGLETETLRQRIDACRECAALTSILLPPREYLAKYIKRDYADLNAVRIAVIGRDSPAQPVHFLYRVPERPTAFAQAVYELLGVRDFAEFTRRCILTDGIRCHATGPRVPSKAMEYCSRHLVDELRLFPNLETLIILGEDAYFEMQHYLLRREPASIAPLSALLAGRGWAQEHLRLPAVSDRPFRVFYCHHPTRGYQRSPSLAGVLG